MVKHGDICVIIVIAINCHRVPLISVLPMVGAIGASILGVRSLPRDPVDSAYPMAVARGVRCATWYHATNDTSPKKTNS